MEGRKESKYNISGTCPECGKMVKVEHIISVDLVELGTTKPKESIAPTSKDLQAVADDVARAEEEEKPDEGKENNTANNGKKAESDNIRPADKKGPVEPASGEPKPADSKKSKRDKKAGGTDQ